MKRQPDNEVPVFACAVRADARDILAVSAACAEDLTRRFGRGHWSGVRTLATIRLHCDTKDIHVFRIGGVLAGTFTLVTNKPTFISKRGFAEPAAPFRWLINFFVHPAHQGCGFGRRCLDEMRTIARKDGAGWIRFDAYAAPAGASAFYEKCGCRRIDETTFRGVGLHVFETRTALKS